MIILSLFPSRSDSEEMNLKKIQLNEMYQAISEEIDGVRFVNFFQEFARADGFQVEGFFCDGTHLNAVGYGKLNEEVGPILEEILLQREVA